MIRRAFLKPGNPPRRISEKRLKANGGKMFSTITAPKKPIPQVNVEQTKRRRARNAKRMRSPEYKAARAGAMERSGSRCEFLMPCIRSTTTIENGRQTFGATWNSYERCPETKRLQFHELRYPKSRPVTKDDGVIYCYAHHMLVESQKLHKWGKRAFA